MNYTKLQIAQQQLLQQQLRGWPFKPNMTTTTMILFEFVGTAAVAHIGQADMI